MTVYLLAGGGTAGHVNPLLALAEHIREVEPESEILILGTAEGLEARLVPERGFELLTIPRLPFPRRPGMYALRFPGRYVRATRDVSRIIEEKNVDVVVGFGGYASAPAYSAAKKSRVPFVVHEANARPGLANVLGARSAAAVAVTFAGTPLRGAVVTGMPLRREIARLDREEKREEALLHFGLERDLPTVLITGGSLGARAINTALSGQAEKIVASGIQVLHIWGGLTELKDPGVAGYSVIKYCDRMDLAFAACDLVISRAGSTAVSEISALGIPAVFVPYESGNGEQRLNARSVVDSGGAVLVRDAGLSPEWVSKELIPMVLDRARLESMSKRSRSAGSATGTQQLYDLVVEAQRKTGA